MKWQIKSNLIIPNTAFIVLVLLGLLLLTACTDQILIQTDSPSLPIRPTANQSQDAATPQTESEAVINLLTEASSEFLHPGWLHLRIQAASDTDQNSASAPVEDSVVSIESQTDCWLDLDENQVIQRSICILADPEGTIIQIGVQTLDESWIIYDGITTTQDRIKTSFTPEIDSLAIKIAKDHPEVRVKKIPPEVTKDVIQLSYSVRFNAPAVISDYALPITQREYVYTFDQQTGMLWLYQEWVYFEDQDPRIATQIKYQEIEFAESPPEEILQYFTRE